MFVHNIGWKREPRRRTRIGKRTHIPILWKHLPIKRRQTPIGWMDKWNDSDDDNYNIKIITIAIAITIIMMMITIIIILIMKKKNQSTNRIRGKEEKIDPIQRNEIVSHIKKLKNLEATGPDEIPNEIFNKAEPRKSEIYKKVLQAIADNRTIPEQWQRCQNNHTLQGKGKRGKCSNEKKKHNISNLCWETVRKNIKQ